MFTLRAYLKKPFSFAWHRVFWKATEQSNNERVHFISCEWYTTITFYVLHLRFNLFLFYCLSSKLHNETRWIWITWLDCAFVNLKNCILPSSSCASVFALQPLLYTNANAFCDGDIKSNVFDYDYHQWRRAASKRRFGCAIPFNMFQLKFLGNWRKKE